MSMEAVVEDDTNSSKKELPFEHISSTKPDILDPEKYKPPPTPLVDDNTDTSNNASSVNAAPTIKEESDEHSQSADSMTEAEALQIQKNKERALSPGLVLLTNEQKHQQSDTMDIPSADAL